MSVFSAGWGFTLRGAARWVVFGLALAMLAALVVAILAAIQPWALSAGDVRAGIEKRAPLGTPRADVIAYLERRGYHINRNEPGEGFINASVHHGGFVFCGSGTFQMTFFFDSDQRLQAFQLQDYPLCL